MVMEFDTLSLEPFLDGDISEEDLQVLLDSSEDDIEEGGSSNTGSSDEDSTQGHKNESKTFPKPLPPVNRLVSFPLIDPSDMFTFGEHGTCGELLLDFTVMEDIDMSGNNSDFDRKKRPSMDTSETLTETDTPSPAPVLLKRQKRELRLMKNREAAERSRIKRKDKLVTLEKQLAIVSEELRLVTYERDRYEKDSGVLRVENHALRESNNLLAALLRKCDISPVLPVSSTAATTHEKANNSGTDKSVGVTAGGGMVLAVFCWGAKDFFCSSSPSFGGGKIISAASLIMEEPVVSEFSSSNSHASIALLVFVMVSLMLVYMKDVKSRYLAPTS